MKRLFTFIIAAILGISAFAYDFSAVSNSGHTLYYNITSNTAPYMVEVTRENTNYPYYSTNPTGDLVIPATVTYNNTNYKVTSIAQGAFNNCSGLTSVTIPEYITSIGLNSFDFCSSLTTVNYNAINCTTMGSSSYPVFMYATALTTLNIGSSVTNIPENAFSNCSGLTAVYFAGSIAQWCGITFNNQPLVSAHNLYINNELVTNLTIPGSVTEIKTRAFYGATCLTSLTIPNSVTSIGNSAFMGCNGLTSVTIGNSVTTIPEYAFYGCSSMTALNLPNSLTDIKENAFNDCRSLTTLNLPNSLANIEASAFYSCSNLASLSIPSSVRSIDYRAFYNCSSLNSFSIPNTVTFIGTSVFEGTGWYNQQQNGILYLDGWCLGYKGDKPTGALEIAAGTKKISKEAFASCMGLTSVTLPSSISRICEQAFANENNLTAVYYTGNIGQWCDIIFHDAAANPISEAQNLYIGNSLITDLVIPNSVTEIKDYSFSHASCIETLDIGNGVTRIGRGAFGDCSGMTTVTIGNSVTSIEEYAFYTSFHNFTVYCHAVNPPSISSVTFSNGITVYVPCGCVPAYSNSTWGDGRWIYEDPSCSSVNVDLESSSINVDLFPNPATSTINIISPETISSIEIENVLGQVVKRVDVNSDNASCDVSELPNGIYMMKIRVQGDDIKLKFVKE